MVNMNVQYVRPSYSILNLFNEVKAVWPAAYSKGFVTGYPSPTNISGHNPDSRGIVHAVDIAVDIEGDGTGITRAQADKLCEWLRTQKNARFQYLIYNKRIVGNHTGWKWAPYKGSSTHSDHIHISEVDLAYGDPSPIPASVYDSKEPWGVAAAMKPKAPTPVKDKITLDMTVSEFGTFFQVQMNRNVKLKRADKNGMRAVSAISDMMKDLDEMREKLDLLETKLDAIQSKITAK